LTAQGRSAAALGRLYQSSSVFRFQYIAPAQDPAMSKKTR